MLKCLVTLFKEEMALADTDIGKCKPHSVQAASVLEAKESCIPVQDIIIMVHVGWSNENACRRFYYKPSPKSHNTRKQFWLWAKIHVVTWCSWVFNVVPIAIPPSYHWWHMLIFYTQNLLCFFPYMKLVLDVSFRDITLYYLNFKFTILFPITWYHWS